MDVLVTKLSRRWNRTMSLKSKFAWIAALMAVISVAGVAHAQRTTVSHASHVGVNPFIEPDRPGLPVCSRLIDDYSGGGPRIRAFTYDRLYQRNPAGGKCPVTTAGSVYPLAFSSSGRRPLDSSHRDFGWETHRSRLHDSGARRLGGHHPSHERSNENRLRRAANANDDGSMAGP
jgi:hypothetical protein